MSMYWPRLVPGAIIDVVAPSGRFDVQVLDSIRHFVATQGWVARIPSTLLGPHDFLANTDAARLESLQQALHAPDSDVLWCVRGGHGTTRLIPQLLSIKKPIKPKLIVGFSDITGLHLLANQCWHWPSLHAPMARQVSVGETDARDCEALLRLWQEGLAGYRLSQLVPQNAAAHATTSLTGVSIGTCLSLLQTSLATPWQVDARDKIICIEDLNEPAYRLDRLLVHLHNAGIWSAARAIVLGDFSTSPLELEKIARVLSDFAAAQTVPVFRLAGFGHGTRNQPLPLGVSARLAREGEACVLVFDS